MSSLTGKAKVLVRKADEIARKDVQIEDMPKRTLTVGELIFFILGVLFMWFGGKVGVKDKKNRLYVGLAIIFLGEMLF